jgi:hypothetical protein
VLDATIRACSHGQAVAPSRDQAIEQQLQQKKNKLHAAPPLSSHPSNHSYNL